MTREDVIIRLAQTVVYLNGQQAANIAVILPNYDEVKRFSRDFYTRLGELPDWLGVELERRNINTCEWGMSKILFASNPSHLKGRSLNVVYRSKRALGQANNEELDYFNFLAALSQQPVIDFDDD